MRTSRMAETLSIEADQRLPSRTIYLVRQALEWLGFACLLIPIFIATVIWMEILILYIILIVPLNLFRNRRQGLKPSVQEFLQFSRAPFEVMVFVYNTVYSRCKNQKARWDYEMGQPRPIASLHRDFTSVEAISTSQPGPNFLARLPTELRFQIYKEAFGGDTTMIRIAIHRKWRKKPASAARGFYLPKEISPIPSPTYCRCFDFWGYTRSPIYTCYGYFTDFPGRGLLALPLTCKAMYVETIDLLYSQ